VRKEEALIDWSQAAIHIDRQIRAFNPWPVAHTTLRGTQLRLWSAEPINMTSDAPPGTAFAADTHGIKVATGTGVLNLTQLQLAGRKQTSAAEFLNSNAIVGAMLGTARE
jgi:methionyl-tRNA formyltransferase